MDMKDESIRKRSSKSATNRMRPNYDFSGGIRGKYVERYRRENNVVLLDPEIAAAFPDSGAVNDALRALLTIAKRTGQLR